MTMEVARTIQQQLGQKALTMWGAKDLVGSDVSLHFRIGRNDKRITKVMIQLDPSDTYTVSFWKGGGYKIYCSREVKGVYAEDLCRTIAAETGLDHTL